MPTDAQEIAQPALADDAYDAAANALRPLTNDRSKFPFVLKELVSYGFNRNCYGIRWIGASVSLLTGAAALFRAQVISLREPYFQLYEIEQLQPSDGITLLLAVTSLLSWLFHFTGNTVAQAGHAYALRLYEALNEVPKQISRI